MCVSGGLKSAKFDTNFITVLIINFYLLKSSKCKNEDTHKFIIDKLGKIINKGDATKCIAGKEHDAVTQIQTYGSIYVSGTLSDSRANPYNVIDPNASGFWAVPFNVKVAIWQIVFDRQYLVEEINI